MRHARRFLPTLLAAIMLLACAASLHAFPANEPTAPTDAQRKEIEDCLRVADRLKEFHDALREHEARFRALGVRDVAALARREAERARRLEVAKRQECLEKIDEYYGIEAPPGTTYRYDPDSRHYAYVPGSSTKDKKEVIFCPLTFSGGPDLAASVKIHELRHTWQVHNCWSSQPGFWRDCQFWSHLAELDAYTAEERAYDAGVTRGMPEEEKELIRQRIREHARAAFPWLRAFFSADLLRARPGGSVELSYTLFNNSPSTRPVMIVITDGMGWELEHELQHQIIDLPPQEAFDVFIKFPDIPGEAEYGSVNQVELQVIPFDDGTAPPDQPNTTDYAFIMIRPEWEATLLPPTGEPHPPMPGPHFGLRGGTMELTFAVESFSEEPRTLTLEIDDTEGWQLGEGLKPHYTTFDVPPLGSTQVTVPIGIPADAPLEATNVLKYRAFDASEGPLVDFKTASLRTAEKDLGLLPLLDGDPIMPFGQTFIPMVSVANFSDPWLVDSFFDITYRIEGPRGPDSQIVSEGTMTLSTADMASRMEGIAGPTVPNLVAQWEGVELPDPGLYVLVMGIEPDEIDKQEGPGFPDVFPENDTLEIEILVVEPPERSDMWLVN